MIKRNPHQCCAKTFAGFIVGSWHAIDLRRNLLGHFASLHVGVVFASIRDDSQDQHRKEDARSATQRQCPSGVASDTCDQNGSNPRWQYRKHSQRHMSSAQMCCFV
jgi:hypothetical protein